MRLRTLDGLDIDSHIFVRARPQGLRKFKHARLKAMRGHQHIASQGGCDMRHFDLTPLYRSTIGFDRLGSLLDTLGAFEGDTPSYPPYNIERVGENEYRISMAVAGFGDSDLNIEVKESTLTVKGERLTEKEDTTF